MKNKWFFLKDERARIPFSVIGIFLILGSSFTSVYVTRLEQQKSLEISSTMDFSEVENILRYAEAAIATMLNLAGMKALKEIGKNPVITGFNPGLGYDTSDENSFNRDRARDIIMRELNVYLKTNYLYDYFNDERYAVNVVVSDGEEDPIASWSDIEIYERDMEISRIFNIPLIGPQDNDRHSTYWVVSVPITLEIIDLSEDSEAVFTQQVDISTIITSRYPILRDLIHDYETRANGLNTLMVETTAFANVYSLVRGLMHWKNLKPGNVVDNKHLAVIVNGCMLLEQGLVFNSVDPMSLVTFAYQSYETLTSGDDMDLIDIMDSSSFKDSDSFSVDPNEIAVQSVKADSEDPDLQVDTSLDIDLTEIAERPLYNWRSVILNFVDNNGNPVSVELVDPSEEDINNKVEEYRNMGYSFVNIEKGDLEQNQSTVDKINDVISTVYSAEIKTKVERDPYPTIIYGDHTGYPIDNGTGPWVFGYYEFKDTIDKPSKGSVTPGCTLYGKIYDVHWYRLHHWSNKTIVTVGNQTWVEWSHLTTTDDKIEEDVTIRVVLNHYSEYQDTKDDVRDVFYYNNSLDDENLMDTIQKYKDNFLTPNLDDLIKTGDGSSDTEIVLGDFSGWVETESWDALEAIFGQIQQITLDESINYINYPNPIDLIHEAKNDLQGKFNENKSVYLDQDSYCDGSLYNSVGKKAVFSIRKWYVERVEENIENIFSDVEDNFNQEIMDKLEEHFGDNAGEARDSLDKAQDLLSNQLSIPFGFDMSLRRTVDDNEIWSEKIRLAVDQIPDYLDPFETTEYEGKEFWALKLKNICTLGPTGLPILPLSPVTPWVFTMNIWYIAVRGEYGMFKVMDTLDENNPNPLFGHEPQIYVREDKEIWDDPGRKLGENTCLEFEFSTVALAFVPPLGRMVGDTEGDIWNEHTPGFYS